MRVVFTISQMGDLLRWAGTTLFELSQEYPVLVVTGPRQSGKTTLARLTFPQKPYVNLENPDELAFAQDDPLGFLKRFPEGAVLDEVQRCPELFSYIQSIVDLSRQMGIFVLTGSQQFGLLNRISQSLAGRAGLLHLLPFNLQEMRSGNFNTSTLDDLIFYGHYPPVHTRQAHPVRWYNNYIATYMERDVRQLLNVKNLTTFNRFLRLCAGSVGQLTNFSQLAASCGVTHNTARSWLSILEASYLIYPLRPHFRNFRKRMVKTPKLYFYDTGVACRLLGIESAAQLATHPLRGALFENLVLTEILKSRFNRALDANVYFWRNRSGLEVDLLLDYGAELRPLECKSGATVARDWFGNLQRFLELSDGAANAPVLLYGGDKSYERSGVMVVGWEQLDDFVQLL